MRTRRPESPRRPQRLHHLRWGLGRRARRACTPNRSGTITEEDRIQNVIHDNRNEMMLRLHLCFSRRLPAATRWGALSPLHCLSPPQSQHIIPLWRCPTSLPPPWALAAPPIPPPLLQRFHPTRRPLPRLTFPQWGGLTTGPFPLTLGWPFPTAKSQQGQSW